MTLEPAPDSSPDSSPKTAAPESFNLNLTLRRYFKRELVPLLADLRLAIVLLLTIALFSVTGTVIEQGQSPAFYQANYPEHPALFGFLSWQLILTLGLDQVYRTWWFLALLILFGASLTTCTFQRQIPALRWFSRTWNFYSQPRQFQKFALSAELPQGQMEQLLPLLQQRRYKVFQEGEKLYAHKGIVGRVGPILVHASMLMVTIRPTRVFQCPGGAVKGP